MSNSFSRDARPSLTRFPHRGQRAGDGTTVPPVPQVAVATYSESRWASARIPGALLLARSGIVRGNSTARKRLYNSTHPCQVRHRIGHPALLEQTLTTRKRRLLLLSSPRGGNRVPGTRAAILAGRSGFLPTPPHALQCTGGHSSEASEIVGLHVSNHHAWSAKCLSVNANTFSAQP